MICQIVFLKFGRVTMFKNSLNNPTVEVWMGATTAQHPTKARATVVEVDNDNANLI